MVRRLALLVVAFLLVSADSRAFVRFDFEQKFFSEYSGEVKDHALIRANGEYHLFYIRGNPGIHFGHAVSTDLIHWESQKPVLNTGEWDSHAVWAPQIVRDHAGNYVMYYTGVNKEIAQQAGIAWSNNLKDWAKVPWPVYRPDPTWALWSETTFSHGRDPFVLEHQGTWYMLNTAKTPMNRGAIALATSTDMYSWQDAGPLYTNDTWHVLESVQCIERNGKWHLFFTEEAVYGTTHMSNDQLLQGWEGQTKNVIDFGHAPEVNNFDGNYIFSRHTTYSTGSELFWVIRFDTLEWSGDRPQVEKPWPLAANWTRVSGNAFTYSPTFLNNPAARGETVDINFEGASWLSSKELYQGPLGIGAPGSSLGDAAVGVLRSRTFEITGNSISLLVGGGDYPDDCYVALVDAATGDVLHKETGRNTETMDSRFWDVRDYKGQMVYIEVVDKSAAPMGHISCDNIVESAAQVGGGGGNGQGEDHRTREPLHPNADVATSSSELFQNHPNPFNPTTTISFRLAEAADITLDVYDVHGRRVRELASGPEVAGSHTVTWDGRNAETAPVATGIYFYRLTINGETIATRKMILLK